MKKLDRYIATSFIRISLGTIVLTTAMMLVIDLFVNFQTYTSFSAKQTFRLIALHVPSLSSLVIGPSLLFATTYFVSSMYSNNEFISFLSAGIAYRRIIRSIVILSFVITILLFFYNEKIKIPCDIKYDNTKIEYQNRDMSYQYDNRNVSITDAESNITIRATRYIDATKELSTINLATFDENNNLTAKITAKKGKYNEDTGLWDLKNVIIFNLDRAEDGKPASMTPETKDEYTLPNFKIEPKFFRAEGDDIRTMNLKNARSYLKIVKNISREIYAEKCTEFYQRIFSPFIAMIMIMISLSINLKNKKNALMFSIICSLALGVVYYVADMGFSLLAKQGVINPLLSTLLPIIAIIAVAVYGSFKVST